MPMTRSTEEPGGPEEGTREIDRVCGEGTFRTENGHCHTVKMSLYLGRGHPLMDVSKEIESRFLICWQLPFRRPPLCTEVD